MIASLRVRLSIGLSAIILVAGLIAGRATFVWSFDEAIELQDAVLLQVGALAAANRLQILPPPEKAADRESRLSIVELGRSNPAADGLQTVMGDEPRRMLVRTRADGSRVAVSQSTAYRDEIAYGAAVRTVYPFAAAVPFLMLLVGLVVSYSFRPVTRAAAALDARTYEHLARLPVDGMPSELLPFIASINRLLERIGTLFEQRRRFVAGAAHELRTPITALSLQAENVGHTGLSVEGRERLAVLQTGIQRTAHLLEQLIDLAKYEAARTVPLAVVALDEIAKDAVGHQSTFAQARGIDLGFERIESTPVCADAPMLTVLIRNLVDNALRHTPHAGRVDIEVFRDVTRAVLQIEDTGPGIPEPDRERVFEPFFRGGSCSGEGSGLGLSIVRGIVEQLDGTIALTNIKSAARSGLRVTVRLPLAAS